ncbi:unnamed protein product, partial [marine sediment metagenome]
MTKMVDMRTYIGVCWQVQGWWMAWGSGFDDTFSKAKELQVKLAQFAHIGPNWGYHYVPDDSWLAYNGHDYVQLTKALVREFIDRAHSYGMKTTGYMSPAMCEVRLAEAEYPDSILYNDGHPVHDNFMYPQFYVMNPDPSLKYGAKLLEEAKGILDDWGFDGI